MATWEDRIREAAYTSPKSGTRIVFDYEDVSRIVELRTAAFGFPGVDGEYVQQNGYGSRRYPMRCIFWGSLHDISATVFNELLLEPGIGKLEHPMYGTFNVVPFGEITRRDDLKTGANQTIIEVTFWTTIRELFPLALQDPGSVIAAALQAFTLASAQQFADATDLSDAISKAAGKGLIRALLNIVSDTLQQVSDLVSGVNRDFRDLQSTINYGMDVLIGQPLQLAQQIANLITAPARAIDGLKSRLDAYGELFDSIFESEAGRPGDALDSVPTATAGRIGVTRRTQLIANGFHAADLFAAHAMAGSVTSTLDSTFQAQQTIALEDAPSGYRQPAGKAGVFLAKPDAIVAAETLLAQMDAYTAWREAGFVALGAVPKTGTYQLDAGASYAELHRAVSIAAGNLIQISFNLVPERRLVLDRERTIVDLASEFYGHVDPVDGFDPLDYLIETNNLTGSQILELQRGQTVKYYHA